jgi:hypothetical protein
MACQERCESRGKESVVIRPEQEDIAKGSADQRKDDPAANDFCLLQIEEQKQWHEKRLSESSATLALHRCKTKMHGE